MQPLHEYSSEELLTALADHPDFRHPGMDIIRERVLFTAEALLGVPREALMARNRHSWVASVRCIAMASLYELGRSAKLSLDDVGTFFGNRDHGAVINAIKRVAIDFERRADFADRVRTFRKALGLPPIPREISQTSVKSPVSGS